MLSLKWTRVGGGTIEACGGQPGGGAKDKFTNHQSALAGLGRRVSVDICDGCLGAAFSLLVGEVYAFRRQMTFLAPRTLRSLVDGLEVYGFWSGGPSLARGFFLVVVGLPHES